ncbi:hypothetical protein ACFL16_02980 [Patescibacteria group bacterium]
MLKKINFLLILTLIIVNTISNYKSKKVDNDHFESLANNMIDEQLTDLKEIVEKKQNEVNEIQSARPQTVSPEFVKKFHTFTNSSTYLCIDGEFNKIETHFTKFFTQEEIRLLIRDNEAKNVSDFVEIFCDGLMHRLLNLP